ncbi:prephenate dehydratase domain-containing protein [Candidatus Carsonella ruddii]|uniref:prephenate dehydratase domain-containing protein n=1 Tax=Carsonella ruddii TaxID=114186 RepID=UPI003D578AAD
MFKKIFKKKIIFNLFKSLNNFKKKNFLILGPIGNYSFNITVIKINKKNLLLPLKSINFLNLNYKKILPYENNNGGIVRDTINLLLKKKIFINSVLILNVKHNFFLYKKKKFFYLHKQSYKQIKKNIYFIFKKIKLKFTNSNSIINKGINICNFLSSKTFTINTKKIFLKDNLINKTKFIININNKKKKYILSFFLKKNIFLKKVLNLYKNKKIFYFEIFICSLRFFLFIMKYLKNITKIIIAGFYNII